MEISSQRKGENQKEHMTALSGPRDPLNTHFHLLNLAES